MHKTFIRDDSQIEANHDNILLLFPLSKLRTLDQGPKTKDQEPRVTEPNLNEWSAQGSPQGPEPSAARLGPRGFSAGGVGSFGEDFVWINPLDITALKKLEYSWDLFLRSQ